MCLLVMLAKTFLVPGEPAFLSSFLSRCTCLLPSRVVVSVVSELRGLRVPLPNIYRVSASVTFWAKCLMPVYIYFLNNSYIKM